MPSLYKYYILNKEIDKKLLGNIPDRLEELPDYRNYDNDDLLK